VVTRERGMVTAETAVLLPVCVAFVAVALWIVMLGYAQVRLIDSARDAARLVARGTPESAAIAQVRRHAPDGVRFTVRREAGFVVVEASSRAQSPLPGLSWPLRARASCVDEL
jgi:hypothetical protein